MSKLPHPVHRDAIRLPLVKGVRRVAGLLLGLHLGRRLVRSLQSLLPPLVDADCARALVPGLVRRGLDRLDKVVGVEACVTDATDSRQRAGRKYWGESSDMLWYRLNKV